MDHGVSLVVDDRVGIITIDRPEFRNSFTPEACAVFIRAMRAADNDPAVKSVLVRATGKDFSVGGDIKTFQSYFDLPSDERFEIFENKLLIGNRLPRAVIDCSKPVVFAAQGGVAGAAVALCLAADFVVAADNSYFLMAHVLIGLSLDCGLSGLALPAMGIKEAKRMAMLGERATAQDALRLGIASEVVGVDEVADRAMALARKLADGPSTALRETKALLNRAAYGGMVEQLSAEATAVGRSAASPDFQEGVEGILHRRPPRFT